MDKTNTAAYNQLELLFNDTLNELKIQCEEIQQYIDKAYSNNEQCEEEKTADKISEQKNKEMLIILQTINKLSFLFYRNTTKHMQDFTEIRSSHCTHTWIVDHTAYNSHTTYMCTKCSSYK